VGNLEEVTDLTAKALAELLKPIIRKIWLQRQQGASGTIGLMTKPDFEEMEPKELLKEFLKLTREERS